MKQLIFIFLILLINKSVVSQEVKIDSNLSEKQNAEWFMKFEKLSLKSEQITTIKKKIFADTIYVRQNSKIRIIIKNQKKLKKIDCECKIVFVLYFKKGGHLLDPIEHPKTNEILKLITEKNIDNIRILEGYDGTALYGSKGKCGVVLMHSNSRKLKRKIKNVL
ncbi:MAG: hypothetical protein HRT69_05865 [Flavobacteriaceae bacterium]|nr:hypothetical protein [Flavobacteriaceae bacterium]